MFVVTETEQLNFWLRLIAPRVVLTVSPEFGDVFDPSDSGKDPTELFVRTVLKRLPPSPGLIRPVVVVEGLGSINGRLRDRAREVITRALENWGAAAAVISS